MYAESLIEFSKSAKREDVQSAVARLASYYVRRGKFRVLDAIARELVAQLHKRDGVYTVTVLSAHSLVEADIRFIEQTAAKLHGGRPEAAITVDTSLIAGAVITIGDTMIDSSLKSRINKLKNALIPNVS